MSDEELFTIEITDWKPDEYGGVIIASNRYARGDIARDLVKLTSGEEDPCASFLFDKSALGHIENKTNWLVEKDTVAKQYLWNLFRGYIAKGDSFNPFIWEGYFEFVIREKTRDVRFVDYKTKEGYLK